MLYPEGKQLLVRRSHGLLLALTVRPLKGLDASILP